MLRGVLNLVIWPKWVHKHLQEVSEKHIQLGKTLYRFSDFINGKFFTLILKMMILIKVNCTGKFCYRHGNFQTTEAVTGGVLKNQIKVSQNHGKTPNPWSHHHGLITIFFDHYNPFQLSQSFSIITIFFNYHNLFQSLQSFLSQSFLISLQLVTLFLWK